MKKYHFFMSICLIIGFCGILQNLSFAWEMKQYRSEKESASTEAFCAIKKEYQEGISLTFAKKADGHLHLFFAFRDLVFKPKTQYLMNIIFKDINQKLSPLLIETQGEALASQLLKSSEFELQTTLDKLSFYTHLEIIVQNKVFNIPLLEDWETSILDLIRCGEEIYQSPQEKISPQEEVFSDTAQEESPLSIDDAITAPPSVESWEADQKSLEQILSSIGLTHVQYQRISPLVIHWKTEDLSGVYREYSLEDQEGHSMEKLSRIAENTMFSLRRLCQGAFVNNINRIEHIKSKSFIRADSACAMQEGQEVIATALFVEDQSKAISFIQEGRLEDSERLIILRNDLLQSLK